MVAQAKQIVKSNKTTALRLLRQKKAIEKSVGHDYDRKMTLEDVLFKLNSSTHDAEIIQSLRLSKAAGDEVSQSTRNSLGEHDSIWSLLDGIREQQEAQDRMTEAMASALNMTETDDQLMDELDKMEALEKKQQIPDLVIEKKPVVAPTVEIDNLE